MPPMKLFWSPSSPFARTVRVVARERGLSEEIEEFQVDPFSDPAALILANPLCRVPTLICDDGTSLYDSRLICVFLDGHPAASGPMLIPPRGSDHWAVLKAQALAHGAMELAVGLTLERRKPDGEKSPTTAARWRLQLTQALDVMARDLDHLSEQPMLGHFAVACLLGYLDFRHPDFGWPAGRANLAASYAQIESRPSLRATTPK
jgi:glutathione S-transferase